MCGSTSNRRQVLLPSSPRIRSLLCRTLADRAPPATADGNFGRDRRRSCASRRRSFWYDAERSSDLFSFAVSFYNSHAQWRSRSGQEIHRTPGCIFLRRLYLKESTFTTTQALEVWTGIDAAALVQSNRTIDAAFDEVRPLVDDLLQSPDRLREELSKNRFAYTDHAPVDESVFVYFDLSPSIPVQERVAAVRVRIMEVLSTRCDVRYTDVAEQHCTAFIEMLGSPLGDLQKYIEQTAREYENAVAAEPPFLLWIDNPVLLRGGVVLSCRVSSTVVGNLRSIARRSKPPLPKCATRTIHRLLHSTVAYIADATADDLKRLSNEFAEWPSQCLPVFIREVRVIGTQNKRLVGRPVMLPLKGGYFRSIADPLDVLETLLHECTSWCNDEMVNRRVFETGLQALRCSTDVRILRAALKLVETCSRARGMNL